MAEIKTPIVRESLEDSWESLSRAVLQCKSERDGLLEACKFAEDWARTFLPHQGPAEDELLDRLQAAIKKAERPAE